MTESEAFQKLELLKMERPDEAELLRTIELGASIAEGNLLGAVDSRGCLHLLIPVNRDAKITSDLASRGVGIVGQDLGTSTQARPMLDLHCRIPDRNSVFQALAVQVVDAVVETHDRAAKIPYEFLNSWRNAFERDPSAGLGRKAMLGLYGEFVVLDWLLQQDPSIDLDCWTGPSGQRHDFRGADASIEVKTTEAGDSRVVEIHGIEQLDSLDDQDLYLAHVRVESHREGRSAADLIEAVAERIAGDDRLHERLKLARYVESPAAREKFQVRELSFFRVDDHFPRLSPSALKAGAAPAGVLNVSYRIDLSSVGPPLADPDVEAISRKMSPGF